MEHIFTNAALPGTSSEYESKANTGTPKDLHRLHQAVVGTNRDFRRLYQFPPKSYYQQRHEFKTLLTSPISWYIDTKDHVLKNHGASLRLRLAPGWKNYYEFALKGNSMGFNGEGGAKRLEKEIVNTAPEIPKEFYTDLETKKFMDLIQGKPLYYFFATDVRRELVGILGHPKNHPEKRALFELCFDDIDYVEPLKSTEFGSIDPWNIQHKSFARLPQIELEYLNPLSAPKKLQNNMRKWGIEVVTEGILEESLHEAFEAIQMIAHNNDIPFHLENRSKGRIGFEVQENGPIALETPEQRAKTTENLELVSA